MVNCNMIHIARDPEKLHKFTVNYVSENHCLMLFQIWGSVWPRVIPYCFLNVFLTAVLQYYKSHYPSWQLDITNRGHSYVTLVLAFLVVTRASVSYSRYYTCRKDLEIIFTKARELSQMAFVFTSENNTLRAKNWRHQVSYSLLLTIRSVMSVIDYRTHGVPTWELVELEQSLKDQLHKHLFFGEGEKSAAAGASALENKLSMNEENMRAPVQLSYLLRKTIVSQRTQLKKPLAELEELALITCVNGFMGGYYGGIEYVSVELDDPFGNDENDFDNLRMAFVDFEDTYVQIAESDGPEWADKLRLRLDDPNNHDMIPEEAALWIRPLGEPAGAV